MPKHIDYGPFQGDGRMKIPPTSVLACTAPLELTLAQCRRLVKMMIDTGHSTHSGHGSTLWASLLYLQGQALPYQLTAVPGEGYHIKLLPKPYVPEPVGFPTEFRNYKGEMRPAVLPSYYTRLWADAAKGIALYQMQVGRVSKDDYCVQYCLEVKPGLTYAQAAQQLGKCILHALACEGSLIDGRD